MTENGHRTKTEKVTQWIGSSPSLYLHTLLFVAACLIGVFELISWDMILLVLTTSVSLEAIYLAIFIQMTVNRHAESLKGVEEDIEDIQEDIEDITGDDDRPVNGNSVQPVTVETLSRELKQTLINLERFKKQQQQRK